MLVPQASDTARNQLELLYESIFKRFFKPSSQQSYVSLVELGDPSEWRSFLYDFFKWLLEETEMDIRTSIKMFAKDRIESIQSTMLDILWLLDMSIEAFGRADTSSPLPKRSRLASILYELSQASLLDRQLAMERLEPELLEAAEIITSALLFSRRQIRINTTLFYKQQKYNLFREESEGYSRLVALLADLKDEPGSSEKTYSQIEQLIGYFDLDPNRVIDIVLDNFAVAHSKKDTFLAIILKFDFPSSTIANLIGFRLKIIAEEKRPGDSVEAETFIAAFLIKHELISLEQLYPHLSPSDEACSIEASERAAQIANTASKVGAVSLASTLNAIETSTPKPDQFESSDPIHELAKVSMTTNQKAIFLTQLLKLKQINDSRALLDRIPVLAFLCPDSFGQLCAVLDEIVSPFYTMAHDNQSSDGSEMPFGNLLGLILPWLRYLGCGLYLDASLITKLCRIGIAHIHQDSSENVKHQWFAILVNHLLPAISLIHANPAICYEIWGLLRCYSYPIRFSAYGTWLTLYDKYPELLIAQSIAQNDTRKIMRRLAKENVKLYGRLIAKVCHGNAVIAFPLILDQLQSYENLIGPVADALKYLTPFGVDVLSWTLLGSFANPLKDRLKSDGTTIASWLNGLAVFTGHLARKYSTMELESLLTYISNQLCDHNSLDLHVLSELLKRMGGCEPIEDASEAQFEATYGGSLLIAEVFSCQPTGINGIGPSAVKATRRASARLLSTLHKSKLAIPLWILIGQQRNACIYRTNYSQLKLLGSLVDQCVETLQQYGSFLCNPSNLIIDAQFLLNNDQLPSISRLVNEYGIDAEVAFYMHRIWTKSHLQFEDANVPISSPLLTCIERFEQEIKTILPAFVFEVISARFLAIFWSLDLHDLKVPLSRYDAELSRIRNAISLIDNSSDAIKKKKERDKLFKLAADLQTEKNNQIAHVDKIRTWLDSEKHLWFSRHAGRSDIITHVIQHALLPRSVFSPADSLFVANWIMLMHSLGTPNFSSLSLYDRLVGEIGSTIICITRCEAQNYAYTLSELLDQLHRWMGERNLYEKEAIGSGLPGFCQRWDHISSPDSIDGSQVFSLSVEIPVEDLLQYDDFLRVTYKWHLKLHRAFYVCLESKEYMQTRNAILVLTRISAHFPLFRRIGSSLERAISRIRERETDREDLKLLATRYGAILEKTKPSWVLEAADAGGEKKPENGDKREELKRQAEELDTMDIDVKRQINDSNVEMDVKDISEPAKDDLGVSSKVDDRSNIARLREEVSKSADLRSRRLPKNVAATSSESRSKSRDSTPKESKTPSSTRKPTNKDMSSVQTFSDEFVDSKTLTKTPNSASRKREAEESMIAAERPSKRANIEEDRDRKYAISDLEIDREIESRPVAITEPTIRSKAPRTFQDGSQPRELTPPNRLTSGGSSRTRNFNDLPTWKRGESPITVRPTFASRSSQQRQDSIESREPPRSDERTEQRRTLRDIRDARDVRDFRALENRDSPIHEEQAMSPADRERERHEREREVERRNRRRW